MPGPSPMVPHDSDPGGQHEPNPGIGQWSSQGISLPFPSCRRAGRVGAMEVGWMGRTQKGLAVTTEAAG